MHVPHIQQHAASTATCRQTPHHHGEMPLLERAQTPPPGETCLRAPGGAGQGTGATERT